MVPSFRITLPSLHCIRSVRSRSILCRCIIRAQPAIQQSHHTFNPPAPSTQNIFSPSQPYQTQLSQQSQRLTQPSRTSTPRNAGFVQPLVHSYLEGPIIATPMLHIPLKIQHQANSADGSQFKFKVVSKQDLIR